MKEKEERPQHWPATATTTLEDGEDKTICCLLAITTHHALQSSFGDN
jgi:hypothetical protein